MAIQDPRFFWSKQDLQLSVPILVKKRKTKSADPQNQGSEIRHPPIFLSQISISGSKIFKRVVWFLVIK